MSAIGPGDVVECVSLKKPLNTGFPPIRTLLTMGGIYRVSEVVPSNNRPITLLRIQGIDRWIFEGWRFRKIDRADESFTLKIRSCRPVREGVPQDMGRLRQPATHEPGLASRPGPSGGYQGQGEA